MKINIKQKFPCGYELEVNMKALIIDNEGVGDRLGICPLHGKKCVKLEKGGKNGN